jgi:hypothetical protein
MFSARRLHDLHRDLMPALPQVPYPGAKAQAAEEAERIERREFVARLQIT